MGGGPWLVSEEHNDPDPNPQQPVLVVDPSSGKYYRTGVYYAMTHFGRFIQPGAFRIDLRIIPSGHEEQKNGEAMNDEGGDGNEVEFDGEYKLISASAFLEEKSCAYSVVVMSKEWQEARQLR